MSREPQMIDVYWTVQRGRRFTISLSEKAAWASLETFWAYDEDADDWSVENVRELVPVSLGEIVMGEGEVIELDDDAREVARHGYTPVHVFWGCPRCGSQHNTDLYEDPLEQTSPHPNTSIWFCERGEGIVLVRW